LPTIPWTPIIPKPKEAIPAAFITTAANAYDKYINYRVVPQDVATI
jgi:hypothetical protein